MVGAWGSLSRKTVVCDARVTWRWIFFEIERVVLVLLAGAKWFTGEILVLLTSIFVDKSAEWITHEGTLSVKVAHEMVYAGVNLVA